MGRIAIEDHNGIRNQNKNKRIRRLDKLGKKTFFRQLPCSRRREVGLNGIILNMTDRSKLYWRCRRGMLELDLLLQGYLRHHYDSMTSAEKSAFEELLTYPDQMLLEYLMGRMTPVDSRLAHIVKKVRSTAQS